MCDKGAEPQQQGYCGLCRILYQDLNQHLSSLKHLDAVRLTTRGSGSSSLHCSSQSRHSLLERFLHDVLQHHPHSYGNSPSDMGQHSGLQRDDPSLLQQHEETTPPHSPAPPPVHRKPHPLQVTWSRWHRIRRQQQREEFSSESSSSTIEEVIRRYCYEQEDDNNSDSVHFSLPISIETQTEWDAEVQIDPTHADLPLAQMETLLEAQVDVEQDYGQQLEWVLEGPGGVARRGFLEQPIETVLPVPQVIPPSFRGKSWREIEEEDEARVLKLVRQFKTGVRTCYFDSESLARYGRRGYMKKEEGSDILPLFDHETELEHRKERSFRLAARCQVVKLSRATQTLCVPSPAVATLPEALSSKDPTPVALLPEELPAETPPPKNLLSNQLLLSGAFPEKYGSVLCPVQRQTSVLYLLCSPCGCAPHQSDPSPAPRRRRRPARALGSKVTYRRLPLTPFTVKPFTVKPFSVKPRCVRQLFRNLSPELNTGPAPKPSPQQRPATAAPTAPRREGLRSCRPRR